MFQPVLAQPEWQFKSTNTKCRRYQMKNILILGANGQIAKLVRDRLLDE